MDFRGTTLCCHSFAVQVCYTDMQDLRKVQRPFDLIKTKAIKLLVVFKKKKGIESTLVISLSFQRRKRRGGGSGGKELCFI